MNALSVPELRPLRTGELLDRAFRLYRKHFLTLVGIVALFLVPVTLVQMVIQTVANASTQDVVTSGRLDSAYGVAVALSGAVGIVVYLLKTSIPIAAVTRAVAGSYLGESVGTLDSYRRVGRRWLPVLGANVLVILLGIAFLIWAIIPCIGWLTGPGLLIYLSSVISLLIAPAIILEHSTASGSIGRAWNLTRQRFWPVIGFMLLLSLLSLIFVAGPAALVSFLVTAVFVSAGSLGGSTIIATVTSSLTTLLTSLLFLPFQLTAVTLLYFDLRIRLEGFDLAVLASESTGETQEVEAVLAAAPAPARGALITGREVGYFVGLTLALVGVYAGLVLVLLGIGALSGL